MDVVYTAIPTSPPKDFVNSKQKATRTVSRGFPRKYKYLIIFILLFFTYIIISLFWEETNVWIPFKLPFSFKASKPICKPSSLNIFDDSIMHLIKDPEFHGCTYPLAFSSTFNSTLVTLLDLEKEFKSCCYQILTRGTSWEDPDNSYQLSDECYPVGVNKSETVIPNGIEFIVISCQSGEESSKKVMDMHAFVQEKKEVENRIRNYYAQQNKKAFGKESEEEKVNVVIFGTDSVSRQELQRSMPKTYKFLKEELKAFEMRGINTISDGTYANLVPFLSGLETSTLEARCRRNNFYDSCPFIWKNYAEHGYRTIFGEDSPSGLGTFNLLTKGFRNPPTDYYFRPFAVAADVLIGNAANAKLRNNNICYGPRLSFEVLLDYMKKAAHFMGEGKRYLQFIWDTYLTHDAINYGRLGDGIFLKTLKWFRDGGYLNRTVLILMSDHGMRYGEIHQYTQGMIEERLPYLFFVLPSWFEKMYPVAFNNLKLNEERLTTNYDLHETLLDLLNLEGLEEAAISLKEAGLMDGDLPRGISHFLKIPSWRNCELAHIPEHYCTCHKLIDLDVDDEVAKKAADFIVFEINMILKKDKKCAFLSLGDVKDAYKIDYGLDKEELKDKREGYKLSVETLPGEGVFEATLLKGESGEWTVSGVISRTNSYADQSFCVDVKELRMYCYCVDLLQNKSGENE